MYVSKCPSPTHLNSSLHQHCINCFCAISNSREWAENFMMRIFAYQPGWGGWSGFYQCQPSLTPTMLVVGFVVHHLLTTQVTSQIFPSCLTIFSTHMQWEINNKWRGSSVVHIQTMYVTAMLLKFTVHALSCWKVLIMHSGRQTMELVFAGPVHRTEKNSRTELNWIMVWSIFQLRLPKFGAIPVAGCRVSKLF